MSSLPADHDARLERMRLSLDGLSVGDAFGQRFFGPVALGMPIAKELPLPPWRYTDDTEMALAIAQVLAQHGRIDQDLLAKTFAARYAVDPQRGYGPGMHSLLAQIGGGSDWRVAARQLFRGGSFGNGSAMRVAPLGAYFADDLTTAAREAVFSAEVTHCHPEGIAGAIAIAVAAAAAWQWQAEGGSAPPARLIEIVLEHTPLGEVRRGLRRAAQLPLTEWEFTAAELLGNGSNIICADTVPLCVWLAARHLGDYCEALWNTVRVGGDIDTNAAIVGGIVALSAPRAAFPEAWLKHREGVAFL